jgi:S1-C subfamily serine protease
MSRTARRLVLVIAAAIGVFHVAAVAEVWAQTGPRQPYLGFRGHIVALTDQGWEGLFGMQVDSVSWGSPASRMGLERGDVIVNIDQVGFTSRTGYLQALRCASQRPSLIIRDVRTGHLIRRSCRLPHVENEGGPWEPDSFHLAIDLEGDLGEAECD